LRNVQELTLGSENIHVFLTGGYVFDISPFKFKPSFMSKNMLKGAPISLDLSANVHTVI
jgi:hypothetical protein